MIPGFKNQPTPFQPPTLAAGEFPVGFSLTPTPTVAEAPRPLPTPTCTDYLRFIDDQTIPDGTLVKPGESLDKRWLVENSGSCNWNDRYRLKLVAGPAMGVPEEQALYPARSGTQAVIRMLFTAPAEAGLVRTAWQAYNARGEAFGDPFYIEILVEAP